jgi:hypothetical protein
VSGSIHKDLRTSHSSRQPFPISHLVDAFIPIIFTVAGRTIGHVSNAKRLVPSEAIKEEKRDLEEMLEDATEELKHVPPPSPLSIPFPSLVENSHNRSLTNGSVNGWSSAVKRRASQSDDTITSPPSAYHHRTPTTGYVHAALTYMWF